MLGKQLIQLPQSHVFVVPTKYAVALNRVRALKSGAGRMTKMACATTVSLAKDPVLFHMADETKEWMGEFNEAIASELDAIWQAVKDLAISLCGKESGALASSIELESEGGSGKTGVSGSVSQGGVIYENAIFAGNDSTFNFSGQPTSQYALPYHDGHVLPNGDFWEGNPFLEDALDAYDSALEEAVSRAIADVT